MSLSFPGPRAVVDIPVRGLRGGPLHVEVVEAAVPRFDLWRVGYHYPGHPFGDLVLRPNIEAAGFEWPDEHLIAVHVPRVRFELAAIGLAAAIGILAATGQTDRVVEVPQRWFAAADGMVTNPTGSRHPLTRYVPLLTERTAR